MDLARTGPGNPPGGDDTVGFKVGQIWPIFKSTLMKSVKIFEMCSSSTVVHHVPCFIFSGCRHHLEKTQKLGCSWAWVWRQSVFELVNTEISVSTVMTMFLRDAVIGNHYHHSWFRRVPGKHGHHCWRAGFWGYQSKNRLSSGVLWLCQHNWRASSLLQGPQNAWNDWKPENYRF
jgi:hypothetical protein